MKRTKQINFAWAVLLLLVMPFFMASCEEDVKTDLAATAFIPYPASVTATGSAFRLKPGAAIYVPPGQEELKSIGQFLADKLNPVTGLGLEVKESADPPGKGQLYLSLGGDASLGDEGYRLEVTKKLVLLTAHAPAGIFRGVQTLRQMLPASVEGTAPQPGPWILATGTIQDVPIYAFRGAMLDVSRHFFGVDDVKRYIDLVASLKMNIMHLHLSDDQGWRIEIKAWPNLTAHGGTTQVGGAKGGFYTQAQYTDLVQYAQQRYITIVPEIDMPGHTNAALASYPELNCSGKSPELYTGTEVGFSTLCTNKEVTYRFIDDVVKELAALTPGPYLHVGGDESHATKKEDYIPFINKVKDIVAAHGKQMIGWDETAQADLKANAVVQLWASPDFAKMAVAKGAKLIMSPANKTYLDMQYDSTTRIGLHWAAYIEVDSAYLWDPATLLPGISKADILGVEAPLWTETITTMDDIEYMAFPRLVGIAELAWSPNAGKDWPGYKARLLQYADRMKAMGIDFYPSKKLF